jgi:hypothetical protein
MRSTGMQAWCVLTPSAPAPAPHRALDIALTTQLPVAQLCLARSPFLLVCYSGVHAYKCCGISAPACHFSLLP